MTGSGGRDADGGIEKDYAEPRTDQWCPTERSTDDVPQVYAIASRPEGMSCAGLNREAGTKRK